MERTLKTIVLLCKLQREWAPSGGLSVDKTTPNAWLNRCATTWPEAAERWLSGLSCDSPPAELLKLLTERFEALDVELGQKSDYDPGEIAKARSLLGSLKKFREPLKDDALLTTEAIERFRKNNLDARAGQIPRRFKPYMREFIASVLSKYSEVACVPTFSGGAVAEKMSVTDRWRSIAQSGLYDFTDPDTISSWARTHYHVCPARLCAVPKDWNKKRLITVEPFELSYLQHATRRRLWAALASCRVASLRRLSMPKRSNPQLAHRVYAQRGSVDGTLATLDLKDASDLVSFSQVCDVFPADVLFDLERVRSTQYQFVSRDPETGQKQKLVEPMFMFGGMGNAVTFTVETLMFHAACHAIARYHRLNYSSSLISVYGDDIVCSSQLADLIVSNDIFSEFGWKVNTLKSYWTTTSRFRESCGMQFYCGHDVTLIRYQGRYHESVAGIQALCDLVNRAVRNRNWSALTLSPWPELHVPNLGWGYAPGTLTTSVPWWPVSVVKTRYSTNLSRVEAYLPCTRVGERVEPADSLGLVYGALSGQLTGSTDTRRRHGRKVHGLVCALPQRVAVCGAYTGVDTLGVRDIVSDVSPRASYGVIDPAGACADKAQGD